MSAVLSKATGDIESLLGAEASSLLNHKLVYLDKRVTIA